MTLRVIINRDEINETLEELRYAGAVNSERMLVWLGNRDHAEVRVSRVYVPAQEAGADFFWIPQESMAALMAELRAHRLMIAAQVHTHPQKAFHSLADDKWAIVRHEGALSLVLPFFGMKTNTRSFPADAAVFTLSKDNQWLRVPDRRRSDYYMIVP